MPVFRSLISFLVAMIFAWPSAEANGQRRPELDIVPAHRLRILTESTSFSAAGDLPGQVQVEIPEKRGNVLAMAAGGIAVGAIGMYAGAGLGYGLSSCGQNESFCGLGGAVVGALIGEVIGVPLGVGMARGSINRLPRGILASVAAGTAGLLLASAIQSDSGSGSEFMILAVPAAQVAATIVVYRR